MYVSAISTFPRYYLLRRALDRPFSDLCLYPVMAIGESHLTFSLPCPPVCGRPIRGPGANWFLASTWALRIVECHIASWILDKPPSSRESIGGSKLGRALICDATWTNRYPFGMAGTQRKKESVEMLRYLQYCITTVGETSAPREPRR